MTAATTNKEPRAKVRGMRTIIVGAGIAGLWLADQLQKRGDDIIVLEKNNYIGGRILTSSHGYEIGAGRISTDHKRVLNLLKRFDLQTFPISHDLEWKAVGDATSSPNGFNEAWAPIIALLAKTPHPGRHTLRTLATSTIGSQLTNNILARFGYRAEVDTLRADLAIHSFQREMSDNASFVAVKGGYSQLTTALAINKDIHLNTAVHDVTVSDGVYHVKTAKKTFDCDRVILALPVNALRQLPCMSGLKTLEYLKMEPLTRIYAQTCGPLPTYLATRMVTDSPLRYIIPINGDKGIIMISYIESQDTKWWMGLKGPVLIAALKKELRLLFNKSPDFNWARAYEWDAGCTYWTPGDYDPHTESQKALRPFPTKMPNLHLCNESFSLRQAWVEGALEHASDLLSSL